MTTVEAFRIAALLVLAITLLWAGRAMTPLGLDGRIRELEARVDRLEKKGGR